MTTINDPEFWEEQWDTLNAAVTAFSGYNSKNTWNTMAADYGKHHDAKQHDERLESTLDRLEKGGVVFEGATILDVGCGPGRYAAAFAQRGARVVAIDISEKMIDRLRAETDPDLLRRITPVIADWKTVDVQMSGYAASFDLVFANMTPAVTDPGSFRKLMQASKKWCWFRGWAGRRSNPLMERFYRALHDEEFRPFNGNFICAWNLVCASGYFPECAFETVGWMEKKSVDELADFYTLFFSGGEAAKQAAVRLHIEASLRENAVDGSVENTVTGHTGGMLWAIDHQAGGCR